MTSPRARAPSSSSPNSTLEVDSDAATVVSLLQKEHNITSIDVVIANAGISKDGNTVAKTAPQNLRNHINTNTIGPMTLFQAIRHLLQVSKTGNPIFVPITSLLSSIASQEAFVPYPQTMSPYGASKVALNWLVARIHFEEPWLTTFVIHPGLVLTDMGSGIIPLGLEPASMGAIDVDASVTGLLKLVDTANRSEFGGKFKSYDGTLLPW